MQKGSFSNIEVGTLYAVAIAHDDHNCSYALFLLASYNASGPNAFLWKVSRDRNSGLWGFTVSSPVPPSILNRIALFVRLASVSEFGDPADVANEITQVILRVRVPPNAHRSVFNGKIWMTEAIGELDDGGFLSCEDTLSLGEEIENYAEGAAEKFSEDGHYNVVKSLHCSES